ncbi:hypothetical protein [Nocardia sp. NRRL S-836]|uniref:hypothetical protein n=1 Tax=Nocardia sp. NRRL S-836 TaxID=1519492 RepID=UPI0012F944EB|nr:hypothetical protein [Nocardia sp. NRRL S-836]
MFDIDGVLVDTREIVRRAYAEVGVELPDHLWGTTWRNWLPPLCGGDLLRAQVVHDRKTRSHLDLLSRTRVTTLAGAEAARELHSRGWTVKFITSGTREVVQRTLHSADPSLNGFLAGTDLDSTGKRKALEEISPAGGVYVDDNYDLGVKVTGGSTWKLVHFHGQAETELIKEIGAVWMS